METTPFAPPIVYPNVSSNPFWEAKVRLEVGPPEREQYVRGGGIWVPPAGRRREVIFLVDSGATNCLLSGSLADYLGLDLTQQPAYIGHVDGELLVIPSTFRAAIGSEWLLLPCFVRCGRNGRIDPEDWNEDILGMEGLLARYN